jgi:hypothetical protein
MGLEFSTKSARLKGNYGTWGTGYAWQMSRQCVNSETTCARDRMLIDRVFGSLSQHDFLLCRKVHSTQLRMGDKRGYSFLSLCQFCLDTSSCCGLALLNA